MHIYFDPQIPLLGIYLKEHRQKHEYAWLMSIDTLLIIAKVGENINAHQLLNEVGWVCSMEYYVGIQKDDVCKDI